MGRTRTTIGGRPACCTDGHARSCGGTCDYAAAEQDRAEAAQELRLADRFRPDAVDLTGRGPAGRPALADGDPF